MSTKLNDNLGNDPDSLFALDILNDEEPYIPHSESFPGFPEWLDKAVKTNPREFLRLQDKFISADLNPSSAYEIAVDFETGKMLGGMDAEQAFKWYSHAAALGSVEAAMRLYHMKGTPDFLKLALLNVNRGLDISTNSELNQHFNITAFTVSKLVELNLADENVSNLLIEIIKHRGFKKALPEIAKQVNQLHISLLGVTTDILCHTVIKHDISDDGDFKLGFYKNLMAKLPLHTLNTTPELILTSLTKEFPWFQNANNQVYKQLKVREQSSQPIFKLRPLLLAGPPGVGKTTWANRLAELVGVPTSIVMAAGSSDSMHLKGLARGWSSSRPGALAQLIAVEKIANPLMIVDEIDKASANNRNGSIWDVLLQLIEPSTSKNYLDECLQVPCDFSWVSWIATCNSLSVLPEPLLDRFTVVLITRPGHEHSQSIINSAICAYAKELGVDPRMLPMLGGDDIEMLLPLSPREINRVVHMMMEDQLTKNKCPAIH